eukprot:CAMPEP_0118921064 /NCGR_PEP_ID=MMETSP1169-20130426/450_1 /TAXON_ID=36882 /ORGANISM="Pyramimonas obovata, Strain CCMP722" /LENGTH=452 /DNA_ID=CAMNT_0006861715 /DNA_START=101 /DNA_END=1459 /DNA_ORIENTATION=+
MAPGISSGFDPLAGNGGKNTAKSSKKAAKAEKAKNANASAAALDGRKEMLGAMMDANQQEMIVRRDYQQAMLQHGNDHIETFRKGTKLADLCYHTGRFQEAEPLLRQSLAIAEVHEELGPDHIETAKIVNNLGNVLRKLGKTEEARPLLERALKQTTEIFGRVHQHTDIARANLVELLDELGHAVAKVGALNILQKSLEDDEAAEEGPTKQARIAASLRGLADMQAKTGQHDAAEKSLLRAIAILEEVAGPNSSAVGGTVGFYANMLRTQEKYALAEPQYERLLKMTKAAIGPSHPQVAITGKALAQIRLKLGKKEAASEVAQEAEAILRNVAGGVSIPLADMLGVSATVHEAMGEGEKAAAAKKEAEEVRAKVAAQVEGADASMKAAQDKVKAVMMARQQQQARDNNNAPPGMEAPAPLLNPTQERLRKKLEAKQSPAESKPADDSAAPQQ